MPNSINQSKTTRSLSAVLLVGLSLLSLALFISTGSASPSAAPNLDDVGPAENNPAVAPGSSITATFDTNLDAATVTSTTFAVHSTFFGLITGTHGTVGSEITVAPNQPLLSGDRIQVIATDGIESDTNDALNDPTQWGFGVNQTADRCFGSFVDSGTADDSLTGVYSGSAHWIDADNDGDLDVILNGYTGSGVTAQLAINDGGSFTDGGAADTALTPTQDGSLDVGDYNNDGHPDVIITGLGSGLAYSVQIGRNDGGTFADSGADDANLPILYKSTTEWGDYDNDGDLDLLMIGNGNSGAITTIFQNNDGTLEDSGADDANLPPLLESAAAWGDYDNDGDLDLALAGNNGSSLVTQIFRNDAGTFVDSGTVDNHLAGVQQGALDWGDIDGDGDLDLALTGLSDSGLGISKIYEYDGAVFTDTMDVLTGVYQSDVSFGDYNNDGRLDLILTGRTITSQTTEIYQNTDAGFIQDTRADGALSDVRQGSVAWGDHDADGDIDLLITGNSGATAVTKVFTNESCSITIDPATSQLEGDSGNTAFNFTVNRTGDQDTAVTVDYAVSGNANSTDFGGALPSGTITVTAGSADATLSINVSGDSTFESDETFTVTLSNPTKLSEIITATADTIIQNDDSLIHIAAESADKLEGDAGDNAFTFVISRTGYLNHALQVDYAITGDVNVTDFKSGTSLTGDQLLANGVVSTTLTLNVNGDTDVESDENFTVTLSNPDAGGEIGTASAQGTIQNDDGDVDIIAVDAVKSEGDAGNTAFTFDVVRSGATGTAFDVNYTVSGFGANEADADDFNGGAFASGTLNFSSAEITETLTIQVSGDTDFEEDEAFRVDLSGATNGLTIGISAASGTIQNDDTGLSITAVNGSDTEGNDLTFSVIRTGDTTGSNDVDYAVSAGAGSYTADAADFGGSFPNNTLSFGIGETTKMITLTVSTDSDVEADETITVTLTNPTNGANLLTATAAGTIENDDGSIDFGPDGLSQAEGDNGTITYTYGVTLSEAAVAPVSVDYLVSGSGFNQANSLDFGGSYPTGTVNFGIGEDTAQLEIVVTGDTSTEFDESFAVTLSNVTGGYTLNTSSITAIIENDDSSISITVDDATKNEGQNGDTTPFTFLVTRGGNTSGEVTADYAVVLNNADADDFENSIVPSGTITIADGAITATITISISGDTLVESAETFDVELSNPTGATLSTSRATGTIQNDDNGYSISADSPSQPEGDIGVTVFSFTVIRQGTSTTNSTIDYALSGVGANPADADDFGGVLDSGTLNFSSGETDEEITFSIPVFGDLIIENDETFVMTLSNATNDEEISTAQAFATIENDDAGLLISALPGDQVQPEGDSGTTPFNYTLDLVGTYTETVTVDYAITSSGSTANAQDFVDDIFPSGTISFTVGADSQTLAIPVRGDTVSETDEDFTITLSNLTSGVSMGQSTITGTIENDDGASAPTTLFLPSIRNLPPATADLVVDSIAITDGSPTVVIRNAGRLAVTDEFWVDLFVNPAVPPEMVNDTIDTLQSDGMVWGIDGSDLPLEPGETLILTLSSSSLASQNIDSIPAGATVYVHVDSANLNTNYGGVLEGHEIENEPYNNISSNQ